MLFSLFGEVGIVVIGLLWVGNKWFNSFLDIVEVLKNNEQKEIPDAIKHLYS